VAWQATVGWTEHWHTLCHMAGQAGSGGIGMLSLNFAIYFLYKKWCFEWGHNNQKYYEQFKIKDGHKVPKKG
jgi:hypothetical protein